MVTEILKVSNAGKLYSALKYCFRRCQIEIFLLESSLAKKMNFDQLLRVYETFKNSYQHYLYASLLFVMYLI